MKFLKNIGKNMQKFRKNVMKLQINFGKFWRESPRISKESC